MVSIPPQPDSVTVRIAFDGASRAGKTTAAFALSEALGKTDAPETTSESATGPTTDARTLGFDWKTWAADGDDGHSIHTELVTVPGQGEPDDRRSQLLQWADVIVFIADTQSTAFGESAARFYALRAELAGAKPVVVVANKRDLGDAIDLDHVRSGLGLTPDDVLIETVATTGSGIRQAFVFAVRAALAASDGVRFEMNDPEQLLQHFRDAERADDGPGRTDALLHRALEIEHDLREVLASATETAPVAVDEIAIIEPTDEVERIEIVRATDEIERIEIVQATDEIERIDITEPGDEIERIDITEPTDEIDRIAVIEPGDRIEIIHPSEPRLAEFAAWVDSVVTSAADRLHDPEETAAVAAMILAEAGRRAEQVAADAAEAAAQSARQASETAAALVEVEREVYRTRTSAIAEEAIAEAERIVAAARDHARSVEAEALAERTRTLADLDAELAEREAETNLHNDELNASANSLLERAMAESEDIRQLAQVEADTMLIDARAERDAVLEQIEELRAGAPQRLRKAMADAAEAGAGDAQTEVDERLKRARVELEQLRAEHATAQAEAASAAGRARYDALEQGARIIGEALATADVEPDIREHIDTRLGEWTTADT